MDYHEYTPIKIIPDLLTLLNYPYKLTISRIDLEIYDLNDFNLRGSMGFYWTQGIIHNSISINHGMFYSLSNRHAYYGTRQPGDWLCMAIQLRRL